MEVRIAQPMSFAVRWAVSAVILEIVRKQARVA